MFTEIGSSFAACCDQPHYGWLQAVPIESAVEELPARPLLSVKGASSNTEGGIFLYRLLSVYLNEEVTGDRMAARSKQRALGN